jgi:enoyl-CoA hydratase
METLQLDIGDDGIALCTFDRPEVRNALNLAMVEELNGVLDSLSKRADLKVLIFTGGGGKAFISGADIGELRDRKGADALTRINTDLFRRIEMFERPTIAAVRGWCLGGGCELALACDLRLAGDGARFGQPEVGLGIIPGAGGCYRLPRLVGLGNARELIFTGRIIDATEALSIGLVNRVVPDADLIDAARELAGRIAQNSALAIRFAKMILNGYPDMSTEATIALESTAQAACFEDPEKYERMTAFLERKKKPR